MRISDWSSDVCSSDLVLALGYSAGPDVGSLLRAVEEWWIAEDFAPDRGACLARLRTLADRISPELPTAPGTCPPATARRLPAAGSCGSPRRCRRSGGRTWWRGRRAG